MIYIDFGYCVQQPQAREALAVAKQRVQLKIEYHFKMEECMLRVIILK